MLEKVLFVLFGIFSFGVMVAIHEFGHFFTAKLLGVKVNEFAVGMGPAIWKKQKGDTLYALRVLPIGGYCAMEGEDEETGDPGAFAVQSRWKKLVILCAGSVMNFVLGLVIMLCLYAGTTQVSVPVISEFMDGFSWDGESGLMVGDRFLEIDGHDIISFQDASTYLGRNDGSAGIDLVVERQGQRVELRDFPMVRRPYMTENGETQFLFGLVIGPREHTLSGLDGLRFAVLDTLNFVRLVWVSLGDLVSSRVSVSEMSGVIGIVDTIGNVGATAESAADGLRNVLYLVAFISVNLAVMNLLPLPALDGGRIFFVLVNAVFHRVFRRDIPARYEGYIHGAGMVLLLALMAVVAFSDIWKLVT